MNPKLLPISQDIPGLDPFIGSWVCEGPKNVVIDVGPAVSIGRLTAHLRAENIENVDLVLITHIHIDHVGGLASFLETYPTAKVVSHEKGIRHLVDPGKLWEGSLKTLGDLARQYGPIRPVKRERLISHLDIDMTGLRVIETPGHAAHHLSFTYQGHLFVGEAGGIFLNLGGKEYLRPATPPVFFMEETLGTLDRLIALEDQPICYAHLAMAPSSHTMLRRAREQILLWHKVVAEELSRKPEGVVERCTARLFETDPELRAFSAMSAEGKKREFFFAANSVRGLLEALQRNPQQVA